MQGFSISSLDYDSQCFYPQEKSLAIQFTAMNSSHPALTQILTKLKAKKPLTFIIIILLPLLFATLGTLVAHQSSF